MRKRQAISVAGADIHTVSTSHTCPLHRSMVRCPRGSENPSERDKMDATTGRMEFWWSVAAIGWPVARSRSPESVVPTSGVEATSGRSDDPLAAS